MSPKVWIFYEHNLPQIINITAIWFLKAKFHPPSLQEYAVKFVSLFHYIFKKLNISLIFTSLYANFSYFWGWLADKIGRRPVVLLSVALLNASMIAFGLSTSLYMAIFTRFFAGISNGIYLKNNIIINLSKMFAYIYILVKRLQWRLQ